MWVVRPWSPLGRSAYGPDHEHDAHDVAAPHPSDRAAPCAPKEDDVSDTGTTVAPGLAVVRDEVTTDELAELGVDLSAFPGSTAADFKRYPVLTEGGWYQVVKHQPSLTTVSKQKWTLLGPVKLASEGLHLA
jgi:hypothetical protein